MIPRVIRLTAATGVFAWLSFAVASVGTAQEAPKPNSATARVTAKDREDVRRAVLDYVEGFYEGDTTKLQRSLRPELAKYGFWKAKDSTQYAGSQMTYAEALAYARRVRLQNRPTPPTAPKRVELLDVQDQTASAKLTAWWGTDYLLLAKHDGRWMISHVLWQSLP